MDTTLKSEGIKLLVGNTIITIVPANGQLPAKRAYKRKARTSTGRSVGRPRKVVQPQEA